MRDDIRETRDKRQGTRGEKREMRYGRRDKGCGVCVGVCVWVGSVGVGNGMVGNEVVGGCSKGAGVVGGVRGGGGQRGYPPPNKCREFPTYFCRVTRQRVIFLKF